PRDVPDDRRVAGGRLAQAPTMGLRQRLKPDEPPLQRVLRPEWARRRGKNGTTHGVANSRVAMASCRREWTPSFMKTFERCHSMVRGLRNSRLPISTFD